MANALAMYHTVKRPRNPLPGAVYAHPNHDIDLYGHDVEVDVRGYDVTVTNFVRLLTGRHDSTVPPNQRLESDASSNVLVYLSGHGGDGFLKFQGVETLTSTDISDSLSQMAAQRRYGRMLFIVDTCQAESLFAGLTAPDVITVASSKTGENSYSYVNDDTIGLTVVDRVTYFLLHKLQTMEPQSTLSVLALIDWLRAQQLGSTLVVRHTLRDNASLADVPLAAFVGGGRQAVATHRSAVPAAQYNTVHHDDTRCTTPPHPAAPAAWHITQPPPRASRALGVLSAALLSGLLLLPLLLPCSNL